MAAKYTISLKKIIEVIGFDIEYTPVEPSEILVSSLEINRPGLMLSGFTKYFDPERIQIMGVSEIEYLNSFKPEDRYRKVKRLLSKKPVAIILTRGQDYHDDTIELAKKYGVALLKTTDGTGVGVVNARRLFGIGSVKVSEKINMVIQLEPWNAEKNYERLGLENETIDILGIEVPICVVPVTPGRNISIIIEAAAMNNRQKKMGYNAAKQLLHNLGMTDDIKVEENELEIWHNF